jgi:hypothetical protein
MRLKKTDAEIPDGRRMQLHPAPVSSSAPEWERSSSQPAHQSPETSTLQRRILDGASGRTNRPRGQRPCSKL